jgi:ubiquinone/menaquinone biosynthesis C-methylase UbiE
MESTDDAVDRIRAHFDQAVDAEWLRLEQTPAARVSFEIHRRFAADHVRPGMSVLEVGAGPGRFTRAHLLFACR